MSFNVIMLYPPKIILTLIMLFFIPVALADGNGTVENAIQPPPTSGIGIIENAIQPPPTSGIGIIENAISPLPTSGIERNH